MDSYEISANAKINVFLRICGKLPNGYHKLFTVMQEIDIYDDITVNIDDLRPAGISVVCSGMDGIDPQRNLCYKAADRFYANYHNKLVREGAKYKIVFPYTEIVLTKRIPSEAGMGGGSSDAAAVLMVLQEHYGNPFSDEELNKIAVNIGADVPFFLYGGTCLCEGVGEEITQVEGIPMWPVLIVKPPCGVSTPKSFAMVDSMPVVEFNREEYISLFNSVVEAGDDMDAVEAVITAHKDLLINELQAPGIEEVPVIADIIRSLDDNGSVLSLMTGSGSAVFGLFRTGEQAGSVRDILAADERYKDCDLFVTRMCSGE